MNQRFKSVPIFAGLARNTLVFLWVRVQRSRVGTGVRIVQEGEPGNRIYVINKGSVRVLKGSPGTGNPRTLAILKSGDFFGEMCILETLPRSASIETLTPTSLWSLSSLDFLKLYEKDPAQYSILILNIARDLSRRLRKLDSDFASQA